MCLLCPSVGAPGVGNKFSIKKEYAVCYSHAVIITALTIKKPTGWVKLILQTKKLSH